MKTEAETVVPGGAADAAERLAEHRRKAEERAKAQQEEQDARELEAFELAEKLAGEQGKDFAVINNRFGVFAVRKPDTRAIRQWEGATEKQKLSLEWMLGYLGPYIEPRDRMVAWKQAGAERPGLVWQTAEAFVDLMGIDRTRLEKKG